MMNEKQIEALKLAREALKLNCSSQTESPATKAIAAIDEALAEQPAPVAEPHERQDYWQEEARRYAQNAEFWRGKYEAAIAQQQEPWVHATTWRGLTYDEVAPIIQQYHWLPTAFARAIEAKLRELNEHKEKNT